MASRSKKPSDSELDRHPDEIADERDSVSSAPESGEPPGGRESPPDIVFDGSSEWPSTSRQSPKDEL